MQNTLFHKAHTSMQLRKWLIGLMLMGACVFSGLAMGLLGKKIAIALSILPLGILFLGTVVVKPQVGLWFALGFSFIASGLTRYVAIPWGLMLDIVLIIAIIGWALRQMHTRNWSLITNDALTLCALWFTFVFLELANPQSPGPVAWFYAMRGVGFYTIIGFVLTFTYLRDPKYVGQFIETIFILSVVGALWGLRQKFIGIDFAEDHWLFVEGHHDEHILHGVLRVFSFYSDAGQFGASQIMVTLMSGILLLGPFSKKRKFWYLIVFGMTTLGFLYSGTRGALAVPFAGGILYMLISRNFKVLIIGVLSLVVVFGVLKFTFIGQSFQPIARIRTALSADNPSLNARLNNQAILGRYLASRPIGGGIGSAGYWGERFRPGSLLAITPTDSYYVRIWAETGVIGLALHLLLLGFFLGKGSIIAWRLKNPKLRAQILAIMAAYGGILLANYGNQVFLQFPTGIVMSIGLPLVFMAPYYDEIK